MSLLDSFSEMSSNNMKSDDTGAGDVSASRSAANVGLSTSELDELDELNEEVSLHFRN